MGKLSLAVVLLSLGFYSIALAQPTAAASPTVLRERASTLNATHTTVPVELIAQMRETCSAGEAPANIAMTRSSGFSSPDASDTCPVGLLRLAREGLLLAFYRDLMITATGQPSGHEQVPAAVAAAAMKGAPEVCQGSG